MLGGGTHNDRKLEFFKIKDLYHTPQADTKKHLKHIRIQYKGKEQQDNFKQFFPILKEKAWIKIQRMQYGVKEEDQIINHDIVKFQGQSEEKFCFKIGDPNCAKLKKNSDS